MIGTSDVAAERARHVEAVELRQPEVQHDQVGLLGAGPHQRLAAVCAPSRRAKPAALQVVADELDDLRLVVDDEDGGHAAPMLRDARTGDAHTRRPIHRGHPVVGGA